MTIAQQIESLGQRIRADFAGSDVEVTTFPSSAVMMDVRRQGRAFVLAFSPGNGFGVDEISEDEGFDSAGYRHQFAEFPRAAEQLQQLIAENKSHTLLEPSMNLVVLHSTDIESTRSFYSLIGLRFVAEKHGSGPEHFAATLGSLVFEIYPCHGNASRRPLRLGFRVPDVDQVVERLRGHGANIASEPKDSSWGRRAVVEDPNRNRIELTQNV